MDYSSTETEETETIEVEGLSSDEQIRLEALRLAVNQSQPIPDDEADDNYVPEPASTTIDRAKEFEKYIRG